MDWVWKIGLAVCLLLLAIPVVMIGGLLLGILRAYLQHRRDERNREVREVPGLGPFETVDRRIWKGEVDGLSITLRTDGAPPTAELAARVRSVAEKAPALMRHVPAFLASQLEPIWLDHDPSSFELDGIGLNMDETFELAFTHPSEDSLYFVAFRGETPIGLSSFH